jgi:hypothetical protein
MTPDWPDMRLIQIDAYKRSYDTFSNTVTNNINKQTRLLSLVRVYVGPVLMEMYSGSMNDTNDR